MSDNATAHRASDYDAQIETSIPYHGAMHREALRFTRAAKGSPDRWLDTGCGTGSLVAKALQAFPSTHFHLADPSSSMLSEARTKLGDGAGRLSYLAPGGTEALVVEDGRKFDVVTAIQCHHYLDGPGRRRAVAKCHELLRPSGLFIAFENIRPASEPLVELGRQYWQDYQVEMGRTAEEARAHLGRFDREYFPITVEEHLGLLRAVGFERVGLLWYSYMQAGVFAFKSAAEPRNGS